MSDAPLSAGAWAILRALVLGIEIRESDDGWRAFGPGPNHFVGVDASHLSELISCGFIGLDLKGSCSVAVVSESGSKALAEKSGQETSEIFKHLKYVSLNPKTY